MKNKIVVVDIDGTITDCKDRVDKYLSKNDYEGFLMHCGEDKPNKDIIELVELLSTKYKIVFLTGREHRVSGITKEWIKENIKLECPVAKLIYRKDYDTRHDTIVKPENLKKYLNNNLNEEVFLILEDRNSVVDKWRELGYRCLQVAEGNF